MSNTTTFRQELQDMLARYLDLFEGGYNGPNPRFDSEDTALTQILTLIEERVIGEDELVADMTFNMTQEEVAEMDEEMDTSGRIRRNALRASQRQVLRGKG